jgi:hypothetical protein
LGETDLLLLYRAVEASLSPPQVQQLRLLQQSQMQPVLPTPQKKWYGELVFVLVSWAF